MFDIIKIILLVMIISELRDIEEALTKPKTVPAENISPAQKELPKESTATFRQYE